MSPELQATPNLDDLLKPVFVPLSTDRTSPGEGIPISHISQTNLLPKKYVIHRHSQRCLSCNSIHEWSQVYAYNEFLLRSGDGGFVKNLVPVKEFIYNLPVDTVAIPGTPVFCCHECSDRLDLSHLPNPQNTAEYRRTYYIGGSADHKGGDTQVTARKAASPGKKPKSIDDLLF